MLPSLGNNVMQYLEGELTGLDLACHPKRSSWMKPCQATGKQPHQDLSMLRPRLRKHSWGAQLVLVLCTPYAELHLSAAYAQLTMGIDRRCMC